MLVRASGDHRVAQCQYNGVPPQVHISYDFIPRKPTFRDTYLSLIQRCSLSLQRGIQGISYIRHWYPTPGRKASVRSDGRE